MLRVALPLFMDKRVTSLYAENYGTLVRQTCPHCDEFQKKIGATVASMLPSELGRTVLFEIGTGWGDTTKAVLDAVPHARVWSCERNPDMGAIAAEQLKPYGGRVFLEEHEAANLLGYLYSLRNTGALDNELTLIREHTHQNQLQQLLNQRISGSVLLKIL